MRAILILTIVLASASAYAAETRFYVNGMTCPFCASGVEKAFKKIDGYEVETVKIESLKTGEVMVRTKGDKTLPQSIVQRELKETDFTLRSMIEKAKTK